MSTDILKLIGDSGRRTSARVELYRAILNDYAIRHVLLDIKDRFFTVTSTIEYDAETGSYVVVQNAEGRFFPADVHFIEGTTVTLSC